METVLAILMVLGIFLVTPMVIGFAIAGVYILRARRAHRRKPAPTIGEILTAAGLTIEGETATGQPLAARVFMQQPASELNRLLAKAGLSIQEEAIPKHCWEVLHCSPEKRETCPAYARRDVPSWVAIGLDKGERVSQVCVNSTLFDLKTLTP
jgi:hypothetical protein